MTNGELLTISLVISFMAIIVSVLSWTKSRKIYRVEIVKVEKNNPSLFKLDMKRINRKLKYGQFTILSTSENENHYIFVTGKLVKKHYLDQISEEDNGS